MRLISPLLLIFCLAACQRSGQNNNDEAVRQGILDHYAKVGVTAAAMNIKMGTPKYTGDSADVEVSVTPKDRTDIPGTPFKYHLERQDKKWVVVGRASESHGGSADPNAATNPHGGEMPPAGGGAENPHGAMPGAGGSGKMPSPSDLPPTKK